MSWDLEQHILEKYGIQAASTSSTALSAQVAGLEREAERVEAWFRGMQRVEVRSLEVGSRGIASGHRPAFEATVRHGVAQAQQWLAYDPTIPRGRAARIEVPLLRSDLESLTADAVARRVVEAVHDAGRQGRIQRKPGPAARSITRAPARAVQRSPGPHTPTKAERKGADGTRLSPASTKELLIRLRDKMGKSGLPGKWLNDLIAEGLDIRFSKEHTTDRGALGTWYDGRNILFLKPGVEVFKGRGWQTLVHELFHAWHDCIPSFTDLNLSDDEDEGVAGFVERLANDGEISGALNKAVSHAGSAKKAFSGIWKVEKYWRAKGYGSLFARGFKSEMDLKNWNLYRQQAVKKDPLIGAEYDKMRTHISIERVPRQFSEREASAIIQKIATGIEVRELKRAPTGMAFPKWHLAKGKRSRIADDRKIYVGLDRSKRYTDKQLTKLLRSQMESLFKSWKDGQRGTDLPAIG